MRNKYHRDGVSIYEAEEIDSDVSDSDTEESEESGESESELSETSDSDGSDYEMIFDSVSAMKQKERAIEKYRMFRERLKIQEANRRRIYNLYWRRRIRRYHRMEKYAVILRLGF